MAWRLLQLLFICSAALHSALVQEVGSTDIAPTCTHAYQEQPPMQPPCNPYTNEELRLECTSVGPRFSSFMFDWYHLRPASNSSNDAECVTNLLQADVTKIVIFHQAAFTGNNQRRVRSQLRIHNLSPSDVGFYWCQMSQPGLPLLPSSSLYLAEPAEYHGQSSCSVRSGISFEADKCALAGSIKEVLLATSSICNSTNSSISPSTSSPELSTTVGDIPLLSPTSVFTDTLTPSSSASQPPLATLSFHSPPELSTPLLSPTLLSTDALTPLSLVPRPPQSLHSPQDLSSTHKPPLISSTPQPKETAMAPVPTESGQPSNLTDSSTSTSHPTISQTPPNNRTQLLVQLYVAIAMLVLTAAAVIVLLFITIYVCIGCRHRTSVAPGGRGRVVSNDCEVGRNAYSATVIEHVPTDEQECYPYEVPTQCVLNSGARQQQQQDASQGNQGSVEASVQSSHDYEEVPGDEGGGGGLPMQLNRAYRSCLVAGYRVHTNRGFLEEAGRLKTFSHDERTL